MSLPGFLSIATGAIAVAGCVQSGIGAGLVTRFMGRVRTTKALNADLPPVTVLKPLHGLEPMLEEALGSFIEQDYADFQIVFGVQREDDPAIAIVHRLQAQHPNRALDLVIDRRQHGVNRKVGNLINMMEAARHDILVISDSDIHVAPDYLQHVVSTLQQENVGLATTVYAGLPASPNLVRRLGALQINHNFLPGVLLSRLLGREDCLGATMALTRETLQRLGGLHALVAHVADDSVLGTAVRALGQRVAIAPVMTWTTIGEDGLGELFAHELRWGRTVKNVEPLGYALSSIQLPLFWASASVLFAPVSGFSWGLLASVWIIRALTGLVLDQALGHGLQRPGVISWPWLAFRDWMSATIMVASARGTEVAWRGQTMHIRRNTPMPGTGQPIGPGE